MPRGSIVLCDPTNVLALGVRGDIARESLEWMRSDNHEAAVGCIRMSERRADALRFLNTLGRLSLYSLPLPPMNPPDHGRIPRSGRLAKPQPSMPPWIGDKPEIKGGENSNEI